MRTVPAPPRSGGLENLLLSICFPSQLGGAGWEVFSCGLKSPQGLIGPEGDESSNASAIGRIACRVHFSSTPQLGM